MKKFFQEFRDFAMKGNVFDLAVGVIIGGAFGKITSSLVNDIFMPFLGWIIGDIDLTELNIVLKPAVMDGETVVAEAVQIGIGTFIAVIIDFILLALIVFLLVKGMNAIKKATEKKKPVEEPKKPEPSNEEKLLTEIRDLLKK